MTDFMVGWPYPAVVVTLFAIVMLRANATYWLGRTAQRGARRTRAERLLSAPSFRRAERVVDRWGAPVVSLSFLTVGFQTLVNLAAGLTRMPLRRYLPAVTAGGILWALLYATVGFVTVEAWGRLWDRSPVVAAIVLAVILAALVVFVVRTVQDRRSDPTQHEVNDDADQPATTGGP
ncbi:MAG: DedA family protein [Propionibacteriaceae bacterium]